MSTAEHDHYQTLGITPGANLDEVRRAFRALARKHHPDLNPASGAAKQFAIVQAAYEVLGDPAKRAAYDRERQIARTPANDGKAHYTWSNIADPGSRVGRIDDELFEELYAAFFQTREAPAKPKTKTRAAARKR